MAIAVEATVKTILGISSPSSDEQAVLDLVLPEADSAIRNFIGYNPEQSEQTLRYPRRVTADLFPDRFSADVNPQHTRAILTASSSRTLQLSRIPVRSIAYVRVDQSARYGDASGAFASDTAWTEGEEFWSEDEQSGISMSGLLVSYGGWPMEPGTVEVKYTAGYTEAEFANGGAGLNPDPRGLRRAANMTAVAAFHTWQQWRKNGRFGFSGGPIESERLQDYSYKLGNGGAAASITGLTIDMPPAAKSAAGPFIHWGVMRL